MSRTIRDRSAQDQVVWMKASLVLGRFFRLTVSGLCMSIRSTVGIFSLLTVVLIAMTVAFTVRLMHTFMQHLGFFPGMLIAGHGGKNQSGGSKEGGWSGFHGWGEAKIERLPPTAITFCPSILSTHLPMLSCAVFIQQNSGFLDHKTHTSFHNVS